MRALAHNALARWIDRAADVAVSTLYPQGCHVCGEPVRRRATGVACDACWDDASVTPLWLHDLCPRCGAPGGPCAECGFDGIVCARSAGAYAGALRACLLDLKRRPNLCRALDDAIVAARGAGGEALAADVIVPVPLHVERRAKRGYNQAELLARSVARATGVDVETRALARVLAAPRQRVGLDREARRRVVASAFVAARGLVEGRSVLVVDDVLTTGATLVACAAALRSAGATRVVALTAARTLARTG